MIYVSLVASDGSTDPKNIHKDLQLVVRCAHKNAPGLGDGSCGYRFEQMDLKAGFDLRSYFEEVAQALTHWLDKDRVTCLVSKVTLGNLNPLKPDGRSGESLLAMLVLAFPEVHWLFGVIEGEGERDNMDDAKRECFQRIHGLRQLFKPEQVTLFDGGGLRDYIRCRIIVDLDTKREAIYLPRRQQLAVAMDEEPDYAFLHAYTAYRFGYRALALDRWKAVEAVFKKDTTNVDLALEDLYLNFPDGGDGMSDLEKRYKELPGLKCVPNHVIVTSDQRTPGDGDKQERNRRVKRDWKQEHRNGFMKWVHKPHGGIFALWREAGLFQRLKHGLAEGFKWPPRWKAIEREAAQQNEVGGHSSPGILLLIARRLVLRAERMLADGAIITAEEAVRGAVLATDALELLGGKTPTAAAEALALKHQFEIHAECQFVGVEYRIRLRDRFEDIARNAKAISRWFNRKEQARAAMNIELDVINRMVGVFRQYNQFDEEMQCLARLRHLDHSLYMHRSWRIVWWPFLRYVEFLMRSFPNFLFAIVAWMLPLGVILAMDPGVENGQQVVEATINAFFANNPHTGEIVTMIFTTVAAVAGIAHLGIFISHLYTLVSKR